MLETAGIIDQYDNPVLLPLQADERLIFTPQRGFPVHAGMFCSGFQPIAEIVQYLLLPLTSGSLAVRL